MIPIAIVLAFFGAEPGIPPLPSVAPPRPKAPEPEFGFPYRGRSAAPFTHCRAKLGTGRRTRCC